MTDLNISGLLNQAKGQPSAQPVAEFNPDSYLQSLKSQSEPVGEYGPVEAGLSGVIQGATYGFADEIGGAGKAAWNYITGETEDFEYRESQQKLEREFKAMQEQQPGAFLAGEVAGGIASPVGKVLAPIGTAAKLGKMARPAQALAGGALAGGGFSEGTIEGDPSKLATDIGLGAVIAPIAGSAISKGLKATGVAGKKGIEITGKAWNKLVPEEKSAAIKKWGAVNVANVAANLGEEWAEYIYKNPETFGKIPKKMEDLAHVVVNKLNTLRKNTDRVEIKAADLLSDDATVSYPSIKGLITKTVKKFDLNPESKTGKTALKAINNYLESIDFRYRQLQKVKGALPQKLSQKALKKAIIDNSADIYKMSTDMTLGRETALLRTIDRVLRKSLKANIKKKTPENIEYLRLMDQAAEGERTWKRLHRYFRPERPEGVGDARASLTPSQLTLSRIKTLPKRTIALKELDKLDKKLTKEIIESDIYYRTERGVLAGSRNVQALSKAGEALGSLTGAAVGAASGGGTMGAGLGFLVGQSMGKGAGAIMGAITDKYGRKIAKTLITKYSPHAGGTKVLKEKLASADPGTLDKIMEGVRNNEGALVIEMLKSIPSFNN